MPKFTGKFEYLIDGKKVTQEEFQKTVDNNENNYYISIDNLRAVADRKIKLKDPFLSYENLISAPKIIDRFWSSNDTGGTVFEKVQDSYLPPHPTNFTDKVKEYLDNKPSVPDSYVKSFNSAQEKFLENISKQNSLEAYNDIVGHSTRHKAGKEIKDQDTWNDEKRKAVSQAIVNDIASINPEQKQNAEKYQLEDLINKLLNSGLYLSIEDITLIFKAKTLKELEPFLEQLVSKNYGVIKSHESGTPEEIKNLESILSENFGKKEKEGKLDYGELDFDYIDSIALRMSKNLQKYPPKNWQKEMDIKELAKAALRHARKILQPVENDPESLEDHAIALGSNGMMINYQLKNK